jgi:hypothetical protein
VRGQKEFEKKHINQKKKQNNCNKNCKKLFCEKIKIQKTFCGKTYE